MPKQTRFKIIHQPELQSDGAYAGEYNDEFISSELRKINEDSIKPFPRRISQRQTTIRAKTSQKNPGKLNGLTFYPSQRFRVGKPPPLKKI